MAITKRINQVLEKLNYEPEEGRQSLSLMHRKI